MNITDNLKEDISNAPEWFQNAIVSKSEVKVLEAELGNVSYKCWGKGTNDKTIVLIHGTGASKNWWDPIAPFISDEYRVCLLYTSPSPRDKHRSRMPSSA